MRNRFFTLAEANALLSRVRPRLERMMQISAQIRTDSQGGATAMPPGTPWMADPVVAAWQAQDSDAGTRLSAALDALLSHEKRALNELGVEIRDLGLGLVEIPSLLEGTTEVLLCWTLGEREISCYRLPHTSYRTRKSIEGLRFSADRSPAGQVSE